jgi:hypothetical protein
MHPSPTVEHARRLCDSGMSVRAAAREVGVPERTVSDWRARRRRSDLLRGALCPRCTDRALPAPYAQLLGSYLGDGHITHGRGGVQCLAIACDDAWPGVRDEVVTAMTAVLGNSVSLAQRDGCVQVRASSKHWTCLFPQHGPGRKHTRRIVLEPWQEEVVEQHTGLFLRGLFHSDGCRITNWTTRPVAGEVRRYEYSRYFFTNRSTDILDLCATGLDRLGIAHRRPRPDTISVARRAAVAALDEHVGPKA